MKVQGLLFIFVLMFLVGCGVAPQYISETNPGVLRDTIFSVEPRNNGTYTIWMVHDDIGAYCTGNKDFGEQALKAVRSSQAIAVITYRYLQPGDPEREGDTRCAYEGSKYSGVTVYKLLSIEVMQQ